MAAQGSTRQCAFRHTVSCGGHGRWADGRSGLRLVRTLWWRWRVMAAPVLCEICPHGAGVAAVLQHSRILLRRSAAERRSTAGRRCGWCQGRHSSMHAQSAHLCTQSDVCHDYNISMIAFRNDMLSESNALGRCQSSSQSQCTREHILPRRTSQRHSLWMSPPG